MSGRAGWAWVLVGALSAGSAVILGAAGAHWVAVGDDPKAALWLETAQRYQVMHALGLILIGSLLLRRPGHVGSLAALCMALGTLAFSGGLYLQAFAVASLGPVVPIGGSLFILGWLLLVFYAGKALSEAGAGRS